MPKHADHALGADARFMRAENLFLLNKLDEAGKAHDNVYDWETFLGLGKDVTDEQLSLCEQMLVGLLDRLEHGL